MRIGFRSYWKTDRFLYMPLLAFAITRHKLEVMFLGFGLSIWRA